MELADTNREKKPQTQTLGHMGHTGHTSVLLEESIEALSIKEDGVYVDATLGGAGHAHAIAEKLGPNGIFLGLDADKDAVKRAEEKLKDARCTVYLREENFRSLARVLEELSLTKVHGVLMDLGLSSFQLETSGRGFSFQKDEPLAMTFAKNVDEGVTTAYDVVNFWEEENLADILYGFADETFSRRIARAIVEARPLHTTKALADTVAKAVPKRGKTNPATKTFQAIRMAVNDELGALKEGIDAAVAHLEKGGRLAIISFHSTEDRAVKRLFAAYEKAGTLQFVHKKSIKPTREESLKNPRARSAQLRVMSKC